MEGIEQILNARYFEIPKNQRGFGWSLGNLNDLISDLKLAGKKAHYMGPIIVTRDKEGDLEEDNFRPTIKCILEDGQQRLTAFFFLMRALQLRFETIDEGVSVESEKLNSLLFYVKGDRNLRLRNANAELAACFSNCILGSPPMPGQLTAPMNAMRFAHEWATKFFAESDRNECVKWMNRLTNQARFILVDLDSEGVDRYLTFDAINSRGLPLSQFDKIKNFCILIDNVRKLRQSPEAAWYAALQELESFKVGHRASEEAFITELFNVFHNTRASQGDVHQGFVDKYRKLIERADSVLEGDFISFVRLWPSYAASFGLMTTNRKDKFIGSNCSKDAGTWLHRLDNLDLPTITRPLLVAGHMTMSDSEFAELAKACEVYTFRVHSVIRRRKDMNAAGVISLANEILRNTKKVDFALSTICTWLSDWAPLKDVITRLSNGEPKYSFDRAVYGWDSFYYFLYEYEVSVSPLGVSPLPWGANREEKKNTTEHILPQEHRDGSWWETHWPDEMDAEKFKHRLGNLVLTQGNSVLGRKSIDKKLSDPAAVYDFGCTSATNSEKLIGGYTDGTTWDKTSILKREIDLLKFAAERWSIPCCVDNGVVYLDDVFDDLDDKTIQVKFDECVSELEDEDDGSEYIEGDDES
jgi:hypothetical protein